MMKIILFLAKILAKIVKNKIKIFLHRITTKIFNRKSLVSKQNIFPVSMKQFFLKPNKHSQILLNLTNLLMKSSTPSQEIRLKYQM